MLAQARVGLAARAAEGTVTMVTAGFTLREPVQAGLMAEEMEAEI